jgi:hypothetical protein
VAAISVAEACPGTAPGKIFLPSNEEVRGSIISKIIKATHDML